MSNWSEQVNPFAPQRTAEAWGTDIRSLLELAQNDGHAVWFYQVGDRDMALRVGSDDTAPVVWSSDD